MTRAADIEDLAARWLVRREEGGWSDADQAELDAWLDAAPENRVAFWRLEYGWEKADRVAALGSLATGMRRRRPGGSRVWRPLAVGAGLAACLALAVVIAPPLSGPKTYTTAVGGMQAVPLADGSRVELNTQTRLRAAVGPRRRAVWLDEGEAYFEVAHDASRPFVVHAGPRTVTVLGTKFSVRRDGDRVEVAVIEGRVKVEDAGAGSSKPTTVTAGDVVVAEGASTLLAARSTERVAEDLSWREGRLTFDQVTLGEAVAEFNRYNRKQMVILDRETAALQIGGSFEASNLEAFTRLLQRGFGLMVEDDGECVKISG